MCCITWVIFISCILTAIGQGSSFFSVGHDTKVMLLTLLGLGYFGLLYYFKISGRLQKEENAVFMMMLLGIFIRCGYVLLSGLYDRQHDAGIYTGMGTPDINSGHIGYIEYLYKFGKLPDMNPYEVFGYYHPPFHHIISCLWLQLNLFLGTTEELAFENLQILPLLYSCLTMTVSWKILKTLDIDGKGLLLSLAFVIFPPRHNYNGRQCKQRHADYLIYGPYHTLYLKIHSGETLVLLNHTGTFHWFGHDYQA